MPSSFDFAGKARGSSCLVQNWLAKENWETAILKKRSCWSLGARCGSLGAFCGSFWAIGWLRTRAGTLEARPSPAAPNAAWRRKRLLEDFIKQPFGECYKMKIGEI